MDMKDNQPKQEGCPTCHGTGVIHLFAESTKDNITCPKCNGSGDHPEGSESPVTILKVLQLFHKHLVNDEGCYDLEHKDTFEKEFFELIGKRQASAPSPIRSLQDLYDKWVLNLSDNSNNSIELSRKEFEKDILYAQSKQGQECSNKTYEISFGNHLQCQLNVINGEIVVSAAVNGWGDNVPLTEILVNPNPPSK